jgi:hypothetical protein
MHTLILSFVAFIVSLMILTGCGNDAHEFSGKSQTKATHQTITITVPIRGTVVITNGKIDDNAVCHTKEMSNEEEAH